MMNLKICRSGCVYFNVLSQHLAIATEKDCRKPVMIANLQAQISNWGLPDMPNTKLEW
jgi:hypothetical protein